MPPIAPMEEETKERRSQSGPESSSTSEKHPAPTNNATGSDAANKRRRGLGVVTPNACTECRKKRAKCDGKKPCARCKSQKDVECIYEVPVRQSKEHLRHEIETLRRQQRQSDHVLSALVQTQLSEDILGRLRDGQTVDSISDWLGSNLPAGGTTSSILAQPTSATSTTLSPTLAFGAGLGPGGYAPMGSMGHPAQTQHQQQQPQGGGGVDQNSPWNFSTQSHTVSTRSESHPDAMQWISDVPPQSRVGTWIQDQSTEGARYRGLDQILASLDSPDMKVPAGTWTNVTGDASLVQHLLALYFCWEYPTFASLSKEHFLKDFLDGRHRYCSPILVNAMLALGCRFSSQPNTRANPDDPYTSGDHFFKEALRLLYRETNHHTLTTIQALGIMSIREASCGRDSESWYYAGQSVRMAIEMGLHMIHDDDDEDELAVQAATFWGAFALDHAWSLATGSLPQCSCFPRLPPKPAIIDDVEASLWIPYTDDGSNNLGAPLQRSFEQPSNVRSVYKCFCELSELVHQSLYVLHSPGRPVTSRDLLNIYTQYLNWYDRIPEVLRLGHNFTPAVLFAHMYYHFAILLLFRPFIKLRIVGSSIIPRDVCLQAADAMQGLLRSYSQLYTLRRTPSFVPYFVLTSAIMHLAVGAHTSSEQPGSPAATSNASTAKVEDASTLHAHPHSSSDMKKESSSPSSNSTSKLSPRVTEAITQGIADLTELAPCHHFAEQALHILRYLAKKWHIQVNIPPPHNIPAKDFDGDEYAASSTSSLNFFVPNVLVDDFTCVWGIRSQEGVPGPDAQKQSQTRGDAANPPQPSGFDGMEDVQAQGDTAELPKMEVVTEQVPMVHKATSIENPLFWPFPMQGRPMLPAGELLEEAGFAIL
ncbi:fungal-specific transcription factor domain-containing protein [Pseudomassariella vexata]|uniref:Fungal-specific transcription factor domain-domain-containing protein n=1 Tax=Pseudomassariella vexata TaxID=1141098 RepID=A0A1Y2D8X3_9PEZI|nr:fungal-specific transcription factor domain-containing protein [Pseudomassariella vexata]ORY55713.1 fungal-specific transcription factor domain-domain-containing protein [Pseudomassariella vexata]